MKTLVTGGKGFIGTHLTRAFKAETFDIVDGQDIFSYPQVDEAVAGKDLRTVYRKISPR